MEKHTEILHRFGENWKEIIAIAVIHVKYRDIYRSRANIHQRVQVLLALWRTHVTSDLRYKLREKTNRVGMNQSILAATCIFLSLQNRADKKRLNIIIVAEGAIDSRNKAITPDYIKEVSLWLFSEWKH